MIASNYSSQIRTWIGRRFGIGSGFVERNGISLIVVGYLLVVAVLSLYDFLAERDREYRRLDATMRAASFALDQILGADFHDRYTPQTPIHPIEYRRILHELNRFSKLLGLEYVYSMTRTGDTIHFVVSNETRDDTLRHTPSRFYNPYPRPPQALVDAFTTDATTSSLYASYTNIWNSYYSVFVPRSTPSGRRYVLAADIKLKDQTAILRRCVTRDAGLVLVLMLPLLPLVVSQRRLLLARKAISERDSLHLAELRELNEGLEVLIEDRTRALEHAVDDLKRFSYGVSHDLRAPLNAISGFAQILRENAQEKLSQDDLASIDQIVDGADRMAALIHTQLDLATMHRIEVSRETVDLSTLAANVIRELETAGQTWGARTEIQAESRVDGDPILLRIVLQNLLSNAFKYSRHREPPIVRMTCGSNGTEDWFTIEDNGEGFDPDRGEELFLPFTRLHEGATEGHGIGLANVLRIVERHGGAVQASGEPGKGASFRVILPRAVRDASHPRDGFRQASPSGRHVGEAARNRRVSPAPSPL